MDHVETVNEIAIVSYQSRRYREERYFLLSVEHVGGSCPADARDEYVAEVPGGDKRYQGPSLLDVGAYALAHSPGLRTYKTLAGARRAARKG